MVATVPITLLNGRSPVNEFRLASHTGPLATDQSAWSDIADLILNFDKNDTGKFLVTLNMLGASGISSGADSALQFGLVLRDQNGDHPLVGASCPHAVTNPPAALSLTCEAQIVPTAKGSQIVAQWAPRADGSMKLDGSLCTLSAVGSLALKKEEFTDKKHFEYPELFSRGLRLTNYSEVLFLTGYSSTAEKGNTDIVPLTAELQMQWIVDHLDAFFATIRYADGTGFYSKYDIVYFDLVIDKTVDKTAQNAVLKVLENWFGPQKDKPAVIPKPSTGILKKIEGLAFPSTKVEIEFILAH